MRIWSAVRITRSTTIGVSDATPESLGSGSPSGAVAK
jgi:hypothetical protein